MQVPAGFCIERVSVAASALGLAAEELIAALRGLFVEAVGRRYGRGQGHLKEMQRFNFGSNPIVFAGDVPKVLFGGDGEFIGIVQTRVKERSFSVHLQVGHEGIPVRYGTPARPSVQVYASKAKRGWNQCRRRLAVGSKRLAVQNQLSVKLTRAPGAKHGANGGLIHAKEVSNGFQVGSKSHNRSNIEVAVRPTVKSTANSRSESVIDA